MAASSTALRRAPALSRFWSRIGILALAALAIALVLPLFFAGASDRVPQGTRIGGVDVGGLTADDAKTLLAGRAERLAGTPVTFVAGGKRFKVAARQLGVRADWRAAVDSAMREGGGNGILRGYRRLRLELFPQEIVPRVRVYEPGLDYELGLIERAVDTPDREARLVRRGLHISIAAGVTGRKLDRALARERIVRTLASFSRTPVALPVRVAAPAVTVATLLPAQRRAAQIVAAPVRVVVGEQAPRIPRWRLAKILDLRTLRFRGLAADTYFARLAAQVDTEPRDASFAVDGKRVKVVPARDGLQLDVPTSAARILAAAERPQNRVAHLALTVSRPERSTAAAQAMGITGVVGSYETFYGGDANRVHNVQLVAHLVDGKLIAPGATFSFNDTTGERSAAKGFREAPVIINGELQTGLGGGVCQVSTTVFNAAYEAGLRITSRTNHALYISHYPLGRDATVDYPSIDLKFVNDTPRWLLLRTRVGSSSLTVTLYGAPQRRRVETVAQPLRVVAPPPVEKTVDATLDPGETVVDEAGVPAQTTSVERKVYAPNGDLLSDQTWWSSYRAEPRVIRVGPPKPAQPKTPQTQSPAATTPGPASDASTGNPPSREQSTRPR